MRWKYWDMYPQECADLAWSDPTQAQELLAHCQWAKRFCQEKGFPNQIHYWKDAVHSILGLGAVA